MTTALVCRCGTRLEAARAGLICPHCDRPCRLKRETCDRCREVDNYWKKRIASGNY